LFLSLKLQRFCKLCIFLILYTRSFDVSFQFSKMIRKSFFSKLKFLDVYPKTAEEIKEKSAVGAAVSIIGFAILIVLMFSELNDYLYPTRADYLSVNYDTRGEKMKLRMKMLFLDLPCNAVNFDVSDRVGDEAIGPNDVVSKKPWIGDFNTIRNTELAKNNWFFGSELIFEKGLWSKLKTKTVAKTTGTCKSCYEAARGKGQCCNNCWELKRAFVDAGMDQAIALKYEQCAGEQEGCIVEATLNLNRVAGNVHIAVGESHVDGGRHHHHWNEQHRKLGFNSSHYITQFLFGDEFPGMRNPLDGFKYVEQGVGQQQYFLQVVPTVYEFANGDTIETNQYSVTYQYTPVNVNEEHVQLPGIFFKYDISPIKIHMKEEVRSFSRFLTRILAVVGGVWVVLGLVYTAMHTFFSDVLLKKNGGQLPSSPHQSRNN